MLANTYPKQPVQMTPSKQEMSEKDDSKFLSNSCSASCGYTELFSFWDTIVKGPLSRNYGVDKCQERDSESGSTAASSDLESSSYDDDNLSASSDITPIRRTVAVARPIQCDSGSGDDQCIDYDEVSFTYSSFSEDDDENDDMPLNPILSSHTQIIPSLNLSNTIHGVDDDDDDDDDDDIDDEMDRISETSDESFDPKDFFNEVDDEDEIATLETANHLSTIMEEYDGCGESSRSLRNHTVENLYDKHFLLTQQMAQIY